MAAQVTIYTDDDSEILVGPVVNFEGSPAGHFEFRGICGENFDGSLAEFSRVPGVNFDGSPGENPEGPLDEF